MGQVSSRVPAAHIGLDAPFRWLAGGWHDLWLAPVPFLVQGAALALISFAISYYVYVTNAAFWTLVLTLGFVFVAPVLAMGPYEGGRRIEQGERPTLAQISFVRSAFRQDVAYLGLALILLYMLWGRMAQVVYGLSTWHLYRTIPAFIAFALNTPDGNQMLLTGSIVGSALALVAYSLVVVSAPMLLDSKADVFSATAASVKAVADQPLPMLLWAAIIGALVLISAATGFALFIIVFPWLGLASWHAYRELTG